MNSVAIIGGKYRGKQIAFLDVETIRPTPNRIRETLFNWLKPFVQESRCLDAFAGSGVLGLEAYSRGAKEVVWVEFDKKIANFLKKTVDSFNHPSILTVINDSFFNDGSFKKPFDIIFLDPPFHSDNLRLSLAKLESCNLLSPKGLVYFESTTVPMLTSSWRLLKNKKSGQVCYGLLEKNA